MSSLRILVVEDSAPFSQFIRSTLAERRDVQVIGEASDGLEAVHRAEELKPDLILLDIGLPTLNGIDAAKIIRQRCPESRIIFLTQNQDREIMREALGIDHAGYVLKTNAATELLEAIEAARRNP